MESLRLSFCLLAAVASFLYTVITIWHLSEFFSTLYQPHHYAILAKLRQPKDSKIWTDVIQPLLFDTALIGLFVLFHSIFARTRLKVFFGKLGLTVLYRTFYLAITDACLQFLMNHWSHVTDFPLWVFNVKNNERSWWFFTIVHWIAWIGLYGGCILMDVGEFMGIKQVYYYSHRLSDPMLLKNPSLQRLYSHMRHPSFLALVAILWCYPIMTLDRYLIAFLLTVYMWYQFQVDEHDYEYMRLQFGRKRTTMSYVSQVASCQG